MRGTALYCLLVFLGLDLHAQKGTYTITADTVLMTSCDSTELTLRNHTDTVPGFLFNNGDGHTIFKRGLQRLSSGSYIIGADTLKAWLQGGNSFGTTGILGTMDNNPLDLYSNGSQQLRFTPAGHLLFGSKADNGYNKFQFYGAMYDTLGYFSDFTSPFIGANNSGAIRLRWGTSDGVYIGFYYQGNENERAFMATPSDSRPFILQDQIGVSFLNTPFISIGTEFPWNSKFSVTNNNGVNDMTVTHVDTAAKRIVYDLLVSKNGHTTLGGASDDGNQLQVGGTTDISGSLGLGTANPSAQLHTTGSVRFAGLTQDSTQTRVLVSDASGNLYYRSASSLALDNPIRSSLAVNGTIKSKKIIISPDDWADYVFDS